ncbi:hypothetical protein CQ14_08550 [Bradyrhizobium lablabi]|uniref:Uncharacterized protein n=1 Tax=Bradyrhizobium lablabi TaxID=722472 RepID=A0A0R3NE67_9BRAD|nr:hypothetical protein CQ14_08550 [Bradyrhizobium lablabi]
MLKQEQRSILSDIESIPNKLELARATGREKVNAVGDAEKLRAEPAAGAIQIMQIDNQLWPIRLASEHRCYRHADLCVQTEYDVIRAQLRSHRPR